MTDKLHVAVLLGGVSSERDVSLVSGKACVEALRREGYRVSEIDVGYNLWEQLTQVKPDVVFNALHGDWGEDGRVQGVLDMFGKPYTHSGVMASALAMDKHRAKSVLRDAGITVPEGGMRRRLDVAKAHPFAPPYVVKPNGQGSSVGVFIIKSGDAPLATLVDETDMGDFVIVEKYVPGRELTVTVMGERALAVTEIVPNTDWYDFNAKYSDGGSYHVVPAEIPVEATKLCLEWALKAHNALGCRGVSRADFRFDDVTENLTDIVNKMVMLEVNTQPGMTPTSLAPEQAAHCGIEFDGLCRWMVEDASWPRQSADNTNG
ncbi:MAG: D-alanine--D-alanine ligase [Maricaulaceae bacterium]